MPRRPWSRAFTAEPTEVAGLRRALRTQLAVWGLHGIADDAQLCLSELVSNVITHVGPGTPATLAVSMNGVHLRIEVRDPDTRALPTLHDADADAEGGRGMALVDAVAERWGVELCVDRKVTWCELATGLTSPNGHVDTPGVRRVEGLLTSFAGVRPGREARGRAVAEEAVITVITDVLHWLRAHGHDVDETLARVRNDYDATLYGCAVQGGERVRT
ncbi:ATP-binding protein [Streptomyces sp. NPDC088812]|uniref:ATP-binding protein n=1 Tax=Streptomyces sp. NPDC088812 TaxID=3365905 RepID=UPI00381796D3